MKRRTFTFGLGALFAAPAVPLPATPALGSGVAEHFARAKLLARCHDRASPEMLARLMRVDAQTAGDLFTMLRERGVVAQGTDGIMRALNPLNTNCVPNEARHARKLAQMGADLGEKLKRFADQQVENALEDAQKPQESTTQEAELAEYHPSCDTKLP